MKMPRLGGSYVAAGAFSKKTVRYIIGRLKIVYDDKSRKNLSLLIAGVCEYASFIYKKAD